MGGAEAELIECLRGRFGARHVYGISAVAEHRPEHAWSPFWSSRGDRPAGKPALESSGTVQGRPLWLLPKPRRSDQTSYALAQNAGPERIESGWWDGQDVRRDYHVAIGPVGEKLWLYRDCSDDQWYLHGIFG
jgi:protein ImuB